MLKLFDQSTSLEKLDKQKVFGDVKGIPYFGKITHLQFTKKGNDKGKWEIQNDNN